MSQGLFASLYESGRPFALIDTRERRVHVAGHWFGSINIPLSVLSDTITRMVPDRGFPIHLLDWQDAASAAAANRLADLGYEDITSCQTSLPDSFGQGFVKGEFVWSKAFGEVVAHECGLPEVTPADYLADYADAMLFDVRPTAEYAQFTIPTSQSLPNSLLLANMKALKDSGKMALLHCAGRTRSIIGACTLQAAGYDGPFAIFKGGTQAWQLDGYEREHEADRLFATEANDRAAVHDFLKTWGIPFQSVADGDLAAFVAANSQQHLFDVSQDAATGQMVSHGIVRISGTNLIQQTDRSIARYHVPVILFDHGSGSRAAFAGYWLRMMGFAVRIVYLDEQLAPSAKTVAPLTGDVSAYGKLSLDALVRHRDAGGELHDFRASKAYQAGHFKDSIWQNIGALLSEDDQSDIPSGPVALIVSNLSQGTEWANLLAQYGWQIAGIFDAGSAVMPDAELVSGHLDSPIDESALFAGRHHGNMQDSRDYLAWEEELPGQIDGTLLNLWKGLLNSQ